MKVRSESIPQTDLIHQCLDSVDFSDTFSTSNKTDSLEDITKKIFGKAPKWIERLMQLRNYLVKFIGLKSEKPEGWHENFVKGGYVSFFKIFIIEENETILGADDSHLKFRVSVLDNGAPEFNIKVTTLVEYQNRTGKIYMFFVKPFHRVVVKRMVKQAYLK